MKHPLARTNFKVSSGQRLMFQDKAYTIAGKLGDGAVGMVRRAKKLGGNDVAIKFLAPDPKYIDPDAFDDVAARFVLEGQKGARLDHPRIVDIYGYSANVDGEDFVKGGPSNPYLIMELVKGKTVESFIRRTAKTEAGFLDFTQERLFIALQIAEALAYIHKKRLVHRDIQTCEYFHFWADESNQSPNYQTRRFRYRKMGRLSSTFGYRELYCPTHQQGLGTMKYMSPEQAIDPKHITNKSDIYSFGITVYELLTGEILGSPHHVFAIMNARLSRGNPYSRMLMLGHQLSGNEDAFCEKLLDCFLRGTGNRPKVVSLLGCLSALYTLLYDCNWKEELND